MAPRTLLVLRHAHARSALAGERDFDRPLSVEGQARATQLGRTLRDRAVLPDLVLCSSAARTRQTLAALQFPASRVEFVPDLYNAGIPDIGRLVAAEGGNAAKVMVVGHNPAIHGFAYDLAQHGSDLALTSALGRAYPPATLSVFDVQAPWSDAPRLGSRLVEIL